MKRYVVVLVLAGVVFSCMAQTVNDTSRRVVVRPLVEIFVGSHGTFFPEGVSQGMPFSAGALAGAFFPEKKGHLTFKTGFVVDNARFKWIEESSFRVLYAHLPVLVGYEYPIKEKMSIEASTGVLFSRILKYARTNTKDGSSWPYPYPPAQIHNMDDYWNQVHAFQFLFTVSFNYWFHPRFAIQTTPYFRCRIWSESDGFCEPLFCPILGCKVGVLFR